MKQQNFNNTKGNFTTEDIEQILNIIGHGCRDNTRKRLRSVITYSGSVIPNYGILERLIKEGDTWTYVAGQDYRAEMKILRDAILNK